MFPVRQLGANDYDLFAPQIFDYVFNAIEDLIPWDFPGVSMRAKVDIEAAIDLAWQIGTTIDEWEERAARIARDRVNCRFLPISCAA